jgi:hypothetical protein
VSRTPLGRVGEPAEISALVAFLLHSRFHLHYLPDHLGRRMYDCRSGSQPSPTRQKPTRCFLLRKIAGCALGSWNKPNTKTLLVFMFHYPSMIVVRCTILHEPREEGCGCVGLVRCKSAKTGNLFCQLTSSTTGSRRSVLGGLRSDNSQCPRAWLNRLSG